jgi:hypothetical protein
MFSALQLEGRQVEDLATFKVHGGLLGEVLAALTLLQGMNLGVFGIVAEREGAPRVARLATGFTPGLFAQAFGFGLFGAVGRRGSRAVATVLSSGVSQAAHLRLEFEGVIDQAA